MAVRPKIYAIDRKFPPPTRLSVPFTGLRTGSRMIYRPAGCPNNRSQNLIAFLQFPEHAFYRPALQKSYQMDYQMLTTSGRYPLILDE
jgi:hypothetical protein